MAEIRTNIQLVYEVKLGAKGCQPMNQIAVGMNDIHEGDEGRNKTVRR
jgi:hypothetical protein